MTPTSTTSITSTTPTQRLDGLDRLLLILPTLAGLGLGLLALFAAPLLARVTNYPSNDILIYWLAGAGTLGYGVALAIGLLQSDWTGLRFPIIAGLTANALAVIAALIEVAQGRGENRPALYLILLLSLLLALCYLALLVRHLGAARPEPDATAPWLVPFFIFGTIATLGTGLLGYFGVELFKTVFGIDAVNPFIYRFLGAATLGYGVMGIYQATSRRFAELRLALVMGALFNACALALGVLALVGGLPPLLPITLLFAPVILSLGCGPALVRRGR
ncbi:MAG TPA: hypothetical protein VGP82_09755 [Ktedonobacterales bacterium]|nr:hypothetical protein [Ktedonobacterales bacterium]